MINDPTKSIIIFSTEMLHDCSINYHIFTFPAPFQDEDILPFSMNLTIISQLTIHC